MISSDYGNVSVKLEYITFCVSIEMVLDRPLFLGIHFFSMSHFDGKKDPTLPAEEEGPYRKTVAFKQKNTDTKNGHYTHTIFLLVFFCYCLLKPWIQVVPTVKKGGKIQKQACFHARKKLIQKLYLVTSYPRSRNQFPKIKST